MRLQGLCTVLPRLGLILLGWMFLTLAYAAPEVTWVGKFSSDGVFPTEPWKVERFDTSIPATEFSFRHWDGVDAVEAKADKSMAVLVAPVDVDLNKSPMLCWRWRVEAPVAAADIASKSGDDYAARVYLMFRVDSRHLSFSTRAKLALAKAVRGEQVPDAAINYV